MARKVDMSLISELNKGAENQVVKGGNAKSIDPKFPVFATPINEDILVYIPKTNVIKTENGEELKLLHSHLHSFVNGKRFGQFRCITGLAGGPFDQLGYDGTCPACDAMGEVWDLYNKKIATEATRMGVVDPQNDPTDMLKGVKEKARKEMDLQTAEEYVTFPVVIIPQKERFVPTDDAKDTLKVQFVTWRKSRYDKNIGAAVEEGIDGDPLESPAGVFWSWKFTYDTQGKPANARDSAREAKYTVLNTAGKLAGLKKLEKVCEEAAKEFTNEKAIEVIVANQFMYKEDLEAEVGKVMAKTRGLLEASNINSVTSAPGLQAPTPANPNPMVGYGNAPSGDLGVEAPPAAAVEFGQ